MPVEKLDRLEEQQTTIIALLRGSSEYQVTGLLDRVKSLEDYRIANEAWKLALEKDTREWQVALSRDTLEWRQRMYVLLGVIITLLSFLIVLEIVNRFT